VSQYRIAHHISLMDLSGILRGLIVFSSEQGQQNIINLQGIQTDVGPHQSHILWVPAAISPGSKWPEHEADHSLPSSAEIKNA
jgi:hypothetical protein